MSRRAKPDLWVEWNSATEEHKVRSKLRKRSPSSGLVLIAVPPLCPTVSREIFGWQPVVPANWTETLKFDARDAYDTDVRPCRNHEKDGSMSHCFSSGGIWWSPWSLVPIWLRVNAEDDRNFQPFLAIQRTSIIYIPTSITGNWKHELQASTPKKLSLHTANTPDKQKPERVNYISYMTLIYTSTSVFFWQTWDTTLVFILFPLIMCFLALLYVPWDQLVRSAVQTLLRKHHRLRNR